MKAEAICCFLLVVAVGLGQPDLIGAAGTTNVPIPGGVGGAPPGGVPAGTGFDCTAASLPAGSTIDFADPASGFGITLPGGGTTFLPPTTTFTFFPSGAGASSGAGIGVNGFADAAMQATNTLAVTEAVHTARPAPSAAGAGDPAADPLAGAGHRFLAEVDSNFNGQTSETRYKDFEDLIEDAESGDRRAQELAWLAVGLATIRYGSVPYPDEAMPPAGEPEAPVSTPRDISDSSGDRSSPDPRPREDAEGLVSALRGNYLERLTGETAFFKQVTKLFQMAPDGIRFLARDAVREELRDRIEKLKDDVQTSEDKLDQHQQELTRQEEDRRDALLENRNAKSTADKLRARQAVEDAEAALDETRQQMEKRKRQLENEKQELDKAYRHLDLFDEMTAPSPQQASSPGSPLGAAIPGRKEAEPGPGTAGAGSAGSGTGTEVLSAGAGGFGATDPSEKLPGTDPEPPGRDLGRIRDAQGEEKQRRLAEAESAIAEAFGKLVADMIGGGIQQEAEGRTATGTAPPGGGRFAQVPSDPMKDMGLDPGSQQRTKPPSPPEPRESPKERYAEVPADPLRDMGIDPGRFGDGTAPGRSPDGVSGEDADTYRFDLRPGNVDAFWKQMITLRYAAPDPQMQAPEALQPPAFIDAFESLPDILDRPTRLRQEGELDRADAEGHRRWAERLRKLAEERRTLGDEETAEEYEKDARWWEDRADEYEKDAKKKAEEARRAEEEAKRRAQARAESERRAAEDRARQLRQEREARLRAEQDARESERRQHEEIDRQLEELTRQFKAREAARAENRAEQKGPAGQAGSAGDAGAGNEDQPVGDAARKTAINGVGETLRHRFGSAGAAGGRALAGVNDLARIRRFGSAADRVVERGARQNRRLSDWFDLLADPDSKVDPRMVQDAQRQMFKENAADLAGAASPSLP